LGFICAIRGKTDRGAAGRKTGRPEILKTRRAAGGGSASASFSFLFIFIVRQAAGEKEERERIKRKMLEEGQT
jgi:hypothetical protein